MYDLLHGLRIVEGASFIAAPLCGLTFVQLGADVIRFDPIGGGPDFGRWPLAPNGLSLYWEGLNKGKRSIALDLAKPRGRELAVALVTAPGPSRGCFITNYPPAGFLAHNSLSSLRPDLITLRITGSSDGRNAVDYTVNCASGYPAMTGPPDYDQPVNHVLPAWDIAAGLTAAVSLLAALRFRDATGKGTEVQVPLSNVAFSTLSTLGNIGDASVSGKDRNRYGNALYGSFGRDFETADHYRLMVVAITKRQWIGLVAALELEQEIRELEQQYQIDFSANEGARFNYRAALFPKIERKILERRFSELRVSFDSNGVCWGEYQSVLAGLQKDSRLSEANPMFEHTLHPSGESYLTAGYPGIFMDLERMKVRPAPTLGANTDEILADELGLTGREIANLHDDGIVAGPS